MASRARTPRDQARVMGPSHRSSVGSVVPRVGLSLRASTRDLPCATRRISIQRQPATSSSTSTSPQPSVLTRSLASIFAALLGSLLFLFLVAPIAQLVVTAGAEGGARLGMDAELRRALVLTAAT